MSFYLLRKYGILLKICNLETLFVQKTSLFCVWIEKGEFHSKNENGHPRTDINMHIYIKKYHKKYFYFRWGADRGTYILFVGGQMGSGCGSLSGTWRVEFCTLPPCECFWHSIVGITAHVRAKGLYWTPLKFFTNLVEWNIDWTNF